MTLKWGGMWSVGMRSVGRAWQDAKTEAQSRGVFFDGPVSLLELEHNNSMLLM